MPSYLKKTLVKAYELILVSLHQHNDSEGFLCVGSPSDITLCNNVLNTNTYMYSFYQRPYKVGISIIYNLNEKTDV